MNYSRSAARKAAEALLNGVAESPAARQVASMLLQALDEQERNTAALGRVFREAQLLFAEIARRGATTPLPDGDEARSKPSRPAPPNTRPPAKS